MENQNKKTLQRKLGITARRSLASDTAAAFSRMICEKLSLSSFAASANTMLSYQAFGGEVDLSHFHKWAAAAGKRVAFPLCYGDGKMVAALPKDEDAWEIGTYGIRTPIESRSIILDPAELDLVLVPCTAFHNVRKIRCGMGSGYYDRYLPQCKNAVTIALAFENQHIDDLCVDDWDVPLDHAVTERDWY